MRSFFIRSLSSADSTWVVDATISEWGSEIVVVHGSVFRPSELPGFVAMSQDKPVGLLTYNISPGQCEIVTLNSWRERQGIGSALIAEVSESALQNGCLRLFAVTTNNNISSIRFYQNRGFVVSTVRINAVTESRRIKPGIPFFDENGLPIVDEIELEILF